MLEIFSQKHNLSVGHTAVGAALLTLLPLLSPAWQWLKAHKLAPLLNVLGQR
jgi:hypothetical protein